jgi:hypothetical protein
VLVVAALLLAWAAACWFSQPFLEPFLGLWVFDVDPSSAVAITLVWSAGALLIWTLRSGKTRLDAAIRALKANRRHYLMLALIILLFFAIQAPTIVCYYGVHDSDSALVGVTSYHIVDGKTRPIYFYGNHFNGSLVAHATALLHVIGGKNPAYLQLVDVLFYFGFSISLYLITSRLWGGNVALLTALLAALPPGWVHILIRNTHVAPLVCMGALSLYFAVKIAESEKLHWSNFFWLGFTLGVGFWVQFQIVFYMVTVLILLFLKDKLFFVRPKTALALLGFLAGAVPVFVDLFYYPGVMLTRFSSQSGTILEVAGRFVPASIELLKSIPTMLGLPLIPAAGEPVNLIIGGLFILSALACLLLVLVRTQRKIADAFMLRKFNPGLLVFLVFPVATWLLISFTREAADNPPFRYFYLLWTAIPPILALGLDYAWTRRKLVAVAGTILFTLTFLIAGIMADIQITQRDEIWREWVDFCDQHKITRFYGSYWRTYLTNFITRERIIGSNVFDWTYEQYPPYYDIVASSNEPPAYLFDRSTRRSQAKLEGMLKHLGVPFKRVDSPIGTVLMDFGQIVKARQLLGLSDLQYSVVIEQAGVFRTKQESSSGAQMCILGMTVKNNGSVDLKASAENGFVELVLARGDGTEIRRQPLCRDIPAGGSVPWRSVVMDSEIGRDSLSARLEVNGIVIGKSVEISPADLGAASEQVNLIDYDPRFVQPEGPNIVFDEYMFLSGWGSLIEKGDRLLRESNGAESVLGFVAGRLEPVQVTIILAPAKSYGFPLRSIGVEVRCNGKVIVDRFALYFPMRLQLIIPSENLLPGLNRLSFHYDLVEPEYRRVSGRIIIRNTRRAVTFNRIIFRPVRGEAGSTPSVLVEPVE